MLGLGLSIPQVATRGAGVGSGWVLQSGGVKAALDYDFQRNRAYQNGSVSAISSLFSASRASPLIVGNADGTVATVGSNALGLSDLGIDIHGGYTQRLLYTNDLTNAAWTKSNVTATKTAIGPDGIANSASLITVTAAGGTVLQSITLSSAQRRAGARVRRAAGTGPIRMTMDGGATWTTVPVTTSWSRVHIPAQTLANPSIGFKFLVAGDAIEVAYVNLFDGANLYPDVEATSGPVSIAASLISMPAALKTLLNTGLWTAFVVVADVNAGGPGTVLSANGSHTALGVTNGQFGAHRAFSTKVGGAVILSDTVPNSYYGLPYATACLAVNASGRSLSGAGSAVSSDAHDVLNGGAADFRYLGFANSEYLGGRILRLTIWPSKLSDAEVAAITDGYQAKGILVDGDSYTVRAPNIDLVTYVKAQFPGRVVEEAGLGGSTLAQIEARVLTEDQTDRLLVIWDGYYNSYAGPVSTYVDKYSAMWAKFPNAIFLPPVVTGPDTSMTAGDVTTTAAIRDEMISRGMKVIDATALLSLFGDNSVDDNADIAAGRVPRSLTADPVGDPLHLSAVAMKEVGVSVRVMADQLAY